MRIRERREVALKFAVSLAAVAIVVPLLLLSWRIEDPHILSAKYQLWKLGLLELPPGSPIRFRFLNVDTAFRQSMIGKEVKHIQKWYTLVPWGSGVEHQRLYERERGSMPYYWLEDSSWAIEIRDGRIVEFHLIKG
jgi:hypothetical protein